MQKYSYDLQRLSDESDEQIEVAGVSFSIPKLVEAEHALNVAIAAWIEALCAHEVGQDWLFAPGYTYASLHQDLLEGQIRQQQWLAIFYETEIFEGDVSAVSEAPIELEVGRCLDSKGDILTQDVTLRTEQLLDADAEEEVYQRIVKAAKAHAAGKSSIVSFSDPLSSGAPSSRH